MRLFTSENAGLNTEKEFQVYVNLLQDIGIDIADAIVLPSRDN